MDDEGERKGEGLSGGLFFRDEKRILENLGNRARLLRCGFLDHSLYLIAEPN
jgi:hypothetical protein